MPRSGHRKGNRSNPSYQKKPENASVRDSTRPISLANIEQVDPDILTQEILALPEELLTDLLPKLVEDLSPKPQDSPGTLRTRSSLQSIVVDHVLRRVLRSRYGGASVNPKELQRHVLERLVFARADTILVAQTGFGKSLIFQTFTLLTGKITIQIIPLVALGQQQVLAMTHIPGARPCLVTSETKATDHMLFNDIQALRYTHILLGPEQAVSKEFQDVLKCAEFRNRVGLMAIDEAHCLSMWSSFRSEYEDVRRVRSQLLRSVVLFACTASMHPAVEEKIIDHGGFRSFAGWDPQSGIIRMSVDRPDITIVVVRLPANRQMDRLSFLFKDAVSHTSAFPQGQPSPQDIKKTVIFGNTIRQVLNLRSTFWKWLRSRYGYTVSMCYDTVKAFSSQSATVDKEYIRTEFSQPSSRIRILVATSAFGMGMDIPDVTRVVQFQAIQDMKQQGVKKLPSQQLLSGAMEVSELTQRIGRGGRGNHVRCTAYICLEPGYWNTDLYVSINLYRSSTNEG
jgi:superfamily II DNA helicase RecQ